MSRELGGPNFNAGKTRTGWDGGQGRFGQSPDDRGKRQLRRGQPGLRSAAGGRRGAGAVHSSTGGLLSSPSAQLCLLFREHFSLHLPEVCALSWASGTWPSFSPLWGVGELVEQLSVAPWGVITCDLVFTLFFPFPFSSPRPPPASSLSLSFLLCLPSRSFSRSLLSLVVVLVQRRWRAARWSLHYQRVARQGLSHPKRKAEQRLRVTNLSLEPEAGRAGMGALEGRAGLLGLDPCLQSRGHAPPYTLPLSGIRESRPWA